MKKTENNCNVVIKVMMTSSVFTDCDANYASLHSIVSYGMKLVVCALLFSHSTVFLFAHTKTDVVFKMMFCVCI